MKEIPQVLGYGGGRQTVAMCILVARGILPKPDKIVIADTGREAKSTWDYLDTHVQPLMESVGLKVEIAPHTLSTVDLFSKKGELLLPMYTSTGKMATFCSSHWKARVSERYLVSQGYGAKRGEIVNTWIGFAFDERKRIKPSTEEKWTKSYPLVDLMLSKHDCEQVILDYGLPMPFKSACFMCPHRSNDEWRDIRDNQPEQWAEALRLDEELRDLDDRGNIFLHFSRKPLKDVDLDADNDGRTPEKQCALGLCFV